MRVTKGKRDRKTLLKAIWAFRWDRYETNLQHMNWTPAWEWHPATENFTETNMPSFSRNVHNWLHSKTLSNAASNDKFHQHHSDVIMSATASQITGISTICSAVCSSAIKKNQSFVSLAFATSGFHSQMTRNAKNVSIWWRHHEMNTSPYLCCCIRKGHCTLLEGIYNGPTWHRCARSTPQKTMCYTQTQCRFEWCILQKKICNIWPGIFYPS